MDEVASGQMESIRDAMELAVREQWAMEPRRDPPREGARHDASADSRPVILAKVAPSVTRPTLGTSAPPAPSARPRRSNEPRIRNVAVAASTFAEQRLVAALAGSSEREAFCVLQALAARHLDERNARTLGVTGARTGVGKTLTAVNLAICLAKDARRGVFLIDLDLRRPAVHTRFGFDVGTGVEDCLFEGVALTDSLFSPSIDGLAVLPARGGSRNVAQILRSSNLAALLDELKRLRPDAIVVLDLPPIRDRSDAVAFEQLADALLLVVEDGVTKEREYRQTVNAVSQSKLLGTVLNRVEASV